ncbi:peptidase domain-containing ABC transporter [Stenotrophomonas sp. NRRL B-14846]|uniref:peptidase domain-containing ABC transporter n=1 Tax=Stenotrophomonas sp. NRRL B-14846 TaxID=3162882 RepID=UPI003D2E50E3
MTRIATPSFLSRLLGRQHITPVLQGEVSECGLACLAMIAAHHGKHVSLQQLRQRYRVSRDGMSLFQALRVGEELGFAGRPLQLSLQDVRELRLPAILFWEQRHFVVVERVSSRGLDIIDPAVGRRHYRWAEAMSLFSGAALELIPTATFQVEPARGTPSPLSMQSVLSTNPRLLHHLGMLAALAILVQLVAIASPKLFSLVIDEVVVKNDKDLLYLLLYIFGLLFAVSVAASWLRTLVDEQLRVSVNTDLSVGLAARLLRLPTRYFERRRPVDILRRLESTDLAFTAYTRGWFDIAIDGLFAVVFLVLIGLINVKLAGVAVGLSLLFFGLRAISLPAMAKAQQQSIDAETARNHTLLRAITAIETVKLRGQEGVRLAEWANQQAEVQRTRARVDRIQAMSGTAHEAISHANSLVISALGALAVLEGDNSIGDLFSFVLYKDMFMGCTQRMMERYAGLRIAKVELARTSDIVDELPELPSDAVYRSSAAAGDEPVRDLCVAHAEHRYGSFDTPTFSELELEIPAGSKTVISGPSGCGKSTLLKVVAGFHTLDSGQVLVNGVPLQRFGLDQFRRRIALVGDRDEIMPTTLMDNIYADCPVRDEHRLQAALEQAGLKEAALALPSGYSTQLGFGGVELSSGQRQRLLIARALYLQPDLLILDEPTAHLDADARDTVIQALVNLRVTCLVASHDAALVAACDRRFAMRGGKLHPLAAELACGSTA